MFSVPPTDMQATIIEPAPYHEGETYTLSCTIGRVYPVDLIESVSLKNTSKVLKQLKPLTKDSHSLNDDMTSHVEFKVDVVLTRYDVGRQNLFCHVVWDGVVYEASLTSVINVLCKLMPMCSFFEYLTDGTKINLY